MKWRVLAWLALWPSLAGEEEGWAHLNSGLSRPLAQLSWRRGRVGSAQL